MSAALSLNSSGLYIPVHKRSGSNTSSSSRSSSTSRSEVSQSRKFSSPTIPIGLTNRLPAAVNSSPLPTHPHIYTFNDLLTISRSPLSYLPLETREALRASIPEILTNRKMRKSWDHFEHVKIAGNARRSRAAGRSSGPERRRNATAVLDEAGWRGRVPSVTMPVSIRVAAATA